MSEHTADRTAPQHGVQKTEEARVTRADRLRTAIEEEIASGRLPPGSRLEESGLAERFNVSRTPVREALAQLASAGFVEMRPRQGAVVTTLSIDTILELFEVMANLESLCAELCARRMTAEDHGKLVELHRRCEEAISGGDTDAYYEANRRFHEAIYAGSHNRQLEEMTRALRNRVSTYRRIQLKHPGRLRRSWKEHDAIVQAILEGDSELAREVTKQHIAVQGDTFTDFMALLRASRLDVA
ncbi:GntR family transcriptional regulator [Azospirillum picis]|uniref:DNA-binding GntR family transcriptional regulator n=1 Tax=Azospirillum picis TaxID=488438 RepID=A0ABU0MJA9_9PROT|nr:GntR family transcriptional regulator [Azospirillum picis]MBP2299750.1 DNA-binding GntR family transcriptional regulator [Azospirillum picis]MDQ0533546.1 DNA-binding GntR family transcriptional regulator [Azospirillum picis]